jgi:uncharacterized delta-60 repeat protein
VAPRSHDAPRGLTSARIALLAIAAAFGASAPARAADGGLDPAFGNAGVALTAAVAHPSAAAVESDGSLVVAGDSGLARLTARGADEGSTSAAAGAAALASELDGGVVAVFTDLSDARPTVAVIRLTADLKPDPSFNRGRPARIAFPDGAHGTAVTVTPSGDLVVGSVTGSGALALVRLRPDGGLDIGFGNHGVVITPLAHPAAAMPALALGPQGTIVAAGEAGSDLVVARYTTAGMPDRTWGGTGVVTTDLGADDRALAVYSAPGAQVVVAAATGSSLGLVRYNAAGQPTSEAVAPFAPGGSVMDAAFLTDGRILAVGGAGGQFAFARYTPRAALDPSFGDSGLVLTSVGGGSATARRLVLQPDGQAVGVGDAGAQTGIVRLLNAGPPAPTPTPAPAPTLAPVAACFAYGRWDARAGRYADAFGFTGRGWRPGTRTTTIGPVGRTRRKRFVSVHDDGSFAVQLPAPFDLARPAPTVRTVVLVARDVADPRRQASVRVRYVRSSVAFALPRPASARVAFRVAGFPPGARVYAHLYHRGSLRKTVALVPARGACGTVVAHARLLPGAPAPGRWTFSFSARRGAPRRYTRGAAGELFARHVAVRRRGKRLVVIAAP